MQGLIEFATLLEQAEPHHREKILAQAQKEEPELVFQVMKKVMHFEDLPHLDGGILAEILSHVSPKVLAWAMRDLAPDLRHNLLRQLGYRGVHDVGTEEQKMGARVSETLIQGARIQILKTARELEAQGKFVLDLSGTPRFLKEKKKA